MNPTLVIGGTGKTGRRVVARLQNQGLPVRVANRPSFDWNEPSTWPAAVEGVSAAYVTYAPDLVFPGGPEAVSELAELAARNGVRRLVLLSGRGEPEAFRAEQLFAAAAERYGAEWGVVRSAFFMQNFSESFLAGSLAAGDVGFPADGVREPFVDADDIAEVATAVLQGAAPSGVVHEVTGPRLMTFEEATQEVATATGRPIDYRLLTTEGFVEELVTAGLPPEEAEGVGGLFADVLDGRNESATDGVRRVLGREPRDFATFAAAAAAEGAWSVRPD